MHVHSAAASILVLAAAVAAQSYTYSPSAYATVEGPSSSTVPFTATTRGPGYRMQQVHGDLKGTPRVLSALSFRRNGTTATGTTGNARTLDLALSIGDASYAGAGPNFAANYVGMPSVAIARKNVVTPDWKVAPPVTPAPFDFTLQFDAPVLHTGVRDFLYDVQIWSNSAATNDPFTTDFAGPAFANAATTPLGTSCTTPLGVYNLLGTIGALSSGEYRMGPQGFYTPASSTNVLLFGVSDPNLAVPGLCANIRSSAEAVLPMPTSGTNGLWTMPLTYFPGNPSFAGAVVYWQGASLDASQPGIGVALSHGLKLTLQAIPAGVPVLGKRYSNGISATATDAESVTDGALLIQLTH